jgi:hypothetical protein
MSAINVRVNCRFQVLERRAGVVPNYIEHRAGNQSRQNKLNWIGGAHLDTAGGTGDLLGPQRPRSNRHSSISLPGARRDSPGQLLLSWGKLRARSRIAVSAARKPHMP